MVVKTSRKIYTINNDKVFDVFITVIMFAIAILFLIPLLHVLAASFSSGDAIVSGKVGLLPVEFDLTGYVNIFKEDKFWKGLLNTLIYTVIGTVISVLCQMLCAYPLSRKDFKLKGVINFFLVITMYVSGGIIPLFILIQNLNMIDTMWAVIIPGCISVYSIIVIRTYMGNSIPYEVQEAAKIDGCSDFGIFLRVILPLSKPIIFVMILFSVVGYWNGYFNALMFLQDSSLYPLQRVLQDMIVTTEGGLVDDPKAAEQLKYVTIFVSSLPLIIVYPFFQKYFEKGVTMGGVKG